MKRLTAIPSVGLSLLTIGTSACAHTNEVTHTLGGECTFEGCKVSYTAKWTTGGGGGGGDGGSQPNPDPPTPPPGGGGGGGGGGTDPGTPMNPLSMVASKILSMGDFVLDAQAYEMDTAGSTIPYPTTGTGVVVLKRANNTIVAAQTFAWRRTGTVIKFANPDAVNNWAYANAGDATTFTFETNPFSANFTGTRVMSVKSKYEGEQTATFTAHVQSNCGPGVRDHLCLEH